MNLHEYQAKERLCHYGVPIPAFAVASNRSEVEEAIKELSLREAVLKIQVHSGGRGKAGGVKFAKNREEILAHAQQLIGMKLVNAQTGPAGILANQILLTTPIDFEKEYYLSVIMDWELGGPVLLASPEGGMEIEEIAVKKPKSLLKLPLSLSGKIPSYQLVRLAKFMGWKNDVARQGMEIACQLAKAFIENDASLVEVNPLVLTQAGKLWALDAKMSIDDNALFRHPDLAALYDPSQESPYEVLAHRHDLAYVALPGDIGCMVNGAGLAMATMDIIHYYGGNPANFLDVGGGASAAKVAAGFKILLSDADIKAIWVNIFGGIMNCQTIAEGIVSAAKEHKIRVPLVVRLEGTNVDNGRKFLQESRLSIIAEDDFAKAAQTVVAAARA